MKHWNDVHMTGVLVSDPKVYTNNSTLWRGLLKTTNPQTGEDIILAIVAKGIFAEKVMAKVAQRKGTQMRLKGYVSSRSWVGPTGQTQWATEVIVTEVDIEKQLADVSDVEVGEELAELSF